MTRVLGTSFNVRRYESRKDMAVSVLSGKVQVATASGEKEVLAAGRELVKVDNKDYVVKDIPDAAMRGAWKNGEMVFRQQPFALIAAELEDYYAIEINFKSEQLAGLRITGRFSYAQTPDEILRSLCLVNGNKFSREGNNYTVFE
ncbi:DUF4974 domain-containing protein [Chitinophaga sedimenti]|nr:FecR domain-containing protein [Chitinophaga sedimenti]MCK7557470.1 DUF4974 domain-containing protein [Chitinophaga sedimenti]